MNAAAATSRFVLIGPPGAGKGTQAAWMSTFYRVPTISSSQVLRTAVASGSTLGRQVESVMASGGLVTDEVMNQLIGERLAQQDATGGFVLDGFPRTAAQAEALDQLLGPPPVLAIVLDVPEPEIERRLVARRVCSRCRMPQSLSSANSGQRECAYCGAALEQRDDDDEATIRRRLLVYRNAVRPLLDFYDRRRRMIAIDAAVAPRDVSAEIARRVAMHDTAAVKRGRSRPAS
jgi:adenylate kinase